MTAGRKAVPRRSILRPRFVAAAGLCDRAFCDLCHLVAPGRADSLGIKSDRTIGLLNRRRMPEPSG